MARRVVSVIRSLPGAVRGVEPALEANAYAVAEDVDLVVVLRDDAVELAVEGAEVRPDVLAGQPLPAAAAPHDLRGLLESGIGVHVHANSLAARGVEQGDLVAGVAVADDSALAALLHGADAVLVW